MNLPNLPLVVLDTETTGLQPRVNRVIEFASVRVEEGKVTDEYETLVGIDEPLPGAITAITRIRDEDLEGKPPFADVRAEIEQHIGNDTIIVGQNVSFDINMLKGEGIDLSDRPWLDTSMLASLVFPEMESYSLGYVSQALSLHHEPVHRALGDVHATLELLSKCWERLLELSAEEADALLPIMQRAPEAYQRLFAALPAPTATTTPAWLTMPSDRVPERLVTPIDLDQPEVGTVQLIDTPLEPAVLEGVIASALADDSKTHWIAVKNVHATLRTLSVPEAVRVLQPASHLLDDIGAQALMDQTTMTADEATLATKLAWYAPTKRDELPLHGGEKQVWNGKVAGTDQSDAFADQFTDLPSVVLLSHWQLLVILADETHPGHKALQADAHVIIDDASMLEDTATKAYGWTVPCDDLRAAAEGDPILTKFVDVLQIWLERTRESQEIRYLTPRDLDTPEIKGLREQIDALRADATGKVLWWLEALEKLLDPELMSERITWIETRHDGAQWLQSVPERVSDSLQAHLYSRFATSLLVPPHNQDVPEILPPSTDTADETLAITTQPLSLDFAQELSARKLLQEPPAGKTVVLVSSRANIERLYVEFVEVLEEKGTFLICQGWSGGQGRMQAEFSQAEGDAIIVVTPWMFETFELPTDCVDRLVIDTLPFDHPKHTVLSRRSEHYSNAFGQYSLPRLKARLYRLLRTFRRMSTADPEVLICDERLETKGYGKEVWEYVKLVATDD